MSNDKGISAFPDGDKLFEWIATVNGPADSVYDGLKYKLRLEFPAAYPYTAPTVKFVTPCFHPNVDQHGNICLDILKEKWSALYEVRTILLSIQSLLGKFIHLIEKNVLIRFSYQDCSKLPQGHWYLDMSYIP